MVPRSTSKMEIKYSLNTKIPTIKYHEHETTKSRCKSMCSSGRVSIASMSSLCPGNYVSIHASNIMIIFEYKTFISIF